MRLPISILTVAAMVAIPTTAVAESADGFRSGSQALSGKELPPYLQCVPYARRVSGIQIYGDAHTWWQQAAGKFKRGNEPKKGAVMAFRPHRNMTLGHVAAVSKIIDSRTIFLRHSNWSPINGRRGQIENDVKAVDVSPNNDWSSVRVWYHPLKALGKTAWPVHGFIYGKGTLGGTGPVRIAVATSVSTRVQPARTKSSKEFLSAFSELGEPAEAAPVRRAQAAPVHRAKATRPVPQRPAPKQAQAKTYDPVAAAIARYDK